MFNKFWGWYERNYKFNLVFTSFLFLLQIFHLYWLFTEVILFRLTGRSFFFLEPIWGQLSILFDYSEIPALISTSILYIHFLRQKFTYKSLLYLIFINIQWLHLFWITDEYVFEHLVEQGDLIEFTPWLAWVAIAIDYLELPVIYDTLKESIREIKKYLNKKTV
ncbi:MAG TPA: hypothetical protein VD998_04235 [Verrucomicrobiae bacterium]|nr:hypothetical protein [Verrucomicrobiae bacterium]